MAEGGKSQWSFQNSFSRASTDAAERFCEPCMHRRRYVAVEGYCKVCHEYLCVTCLGVHKNQKLTRGHTIIDKNRMPESQEGHGDQDLCLEVCKVHYPEIVRFFCKPHDTPGCVDCMTINHTSCKKDRVQDIADGFQATEEFKLIQRKLENFHEEIEELKESFDDNLKNMDTLYNNFQQHIATFRKSVNDYLDQVQKEITDEAAKRKNGYETGMMDLIAETEAMKCEVEDMLTGIQTDDSNANVNSIFVISKRAKQSLGKMKREITKIQQSQHNLHQQQPVFNPSVELEKLISTSAPLGYLVESKLSVKDIRRTTALYRETLNVNAKWVDKENCWITDCTLLGRDRLVVADASNNNIKLIDTNTKRVVSCHRTSSSPCSVTAVLSDQVAVTLPSERIIQILNVKKSQFTKQHKIEIRSRVYCVAAYSDKKFAVTYGYPGGIEILDRRGNVLHTVQHKQNNVDILYSPHYITFGGEKDTVIVPDTTDNKVRAITFDGTILGTYTHDKLQSPRGLVVTSDGVLFICSWGNGCIHLVSPDFMTSKVIVDKHLADPMSMAYCETTHRLYTTNNITGPNKENNTVSVYDLYV